MIEILAYRLNDTLVPATAMDRQTMAQVPYRQALRVTIYAEVPLTVTRMYWALCAYLAEGTGAYANGRGVHDDLMRRTGQVEHVYVDQQGSVLRVTVRSTRKWGLVEWRQHLAQVMPIVTSEILPGVPEGEVRKTIESTLGIDWTRELS